MDIPKRVLDELSLIARIAGPDDDWMLIKKQLLLSLPSPLRTLFSTRDPKTKAQSLNDFERCIIDEYDSLTGVRLRLRNE